MQAGLARWLPPTAGGVSCSRQQSSVPGRAFSDAQDRVSFNSARTGVLLAGAVRLLLNYRKRRLVRRKMSKADAQTRKEYLD